MERSDTTLLSVCSVFWACQKKHNGLILHNYRTGSFTWDSTQEPDVSGVAKFWGKITINGRRSHILGRDNDASLILVKTQKEK